MPARAQRPSVGNGAWAMPALGRVLVASETEAGVDAALAELIENERFNLNCVVSCARSKDCPIVYASDGLGHKYKDRPHTLKNCGRADGAFVRYSDLI